MDSTYRPQSPDLSSYAPQSPDLSGLRSHTPDLSSTLPSAGQSHFTGPPYAHARSHYGGSRGSNTFTSGLVASPTSVPLQNYQELQRHQLQQFQHHQNLLHQSYQFNSPTQPQEQQQHQHSSADTSFGNPLHPLHQHHHDQQQQIHHRMLQDSHMARQKLPNTSHQAAPTHTFNAQFSETPGHDLTSTHQDQQQDPSRGVQLRTSFPVARIKRIMQADDEIGKVAQVTPHVVSRALELFMINLITDAAQHARGASIASSGSRENGGGGGNNSGHSGGSKSQRRILAQHMKRAIKANERFDFLVDIADKIPDTAPTRTSKKEVNSDSDEVPREPKPASRRRAKKRKDDDDDDE